MDGAAENVSREQNMEGIKQVKAEVQ